MQNATDIALSRLVAQSRQMDVIANNIANANTPGYRAERMLFSDWLSRQSEASAPPGGRVLQYTQDRATYRDQAEGTLIHTGDPLDVAISGTGYFTVMTPNGPRLTRAGHFTLQANGTVGDENGDALLDTQGQPIRLGPADTDVTIAGDGTISSRHGPPGVETSTIVGKIGIVAPADPMRLHAEGARLLASSSPTAPVAAPKLVQGAIEDSNVRPILEMTRMTDALRQFQFVSQFVQAESDRQQNAISKILPNA